MTTTWKRTKVKSENTYTMVLVKSHTEDHVCTFLRETLYPDTYISKCQHLVYLQVPMYFYGLRKSFINMVKC